MIPSAPEPDDHLLERHARALGERRPQRDQTPPSGIAVQLARAALHRLERRRERRKRPLVRGELDDTLEPELALHGFDRLARLVRERDRRSTRGRGSTPAPERQLRLSFLACSRATIFPIFSVSQPTTALRLVTMDMPPRLPNGVREEPPCGGGSP